LEIPNRISKIIKKKLKSENHLLKEKKRQGKFNEEILSYQNVSSTLEKTAKNSIQLCSSLEEQTIKKKQQSLEKTRSFRESQLRTTCDCWTTIFVLHNLHVFAHVRVLDNIRVSDLLPSFAGAN